MKGEEGIWFDYFYKHLHKHIRNENRVDWRLASGHPCLSLRLVEQNPDAPWDWRVLSRLPFERVRGLVAALPGKEWDWNQLSSPPRRKDSFEESVPLGHALKNNHLPWNWAMLSRSPSTTLDHVLHHPSLPWDMEHILANCAFSSYHLRCLAPTSQNYALLSKNPHNTLHVLRRHKDKPWNWSELAQNVAFAPHRVYQHRKELPSWRWDLSLRNPRLTWDFYQLVRKEKNIPHQFHHLLRNHLHHHASYNAYYHIVVRRFLRGVVRRRLVRRKLRLLRALRSKMDRYMVRAILRDYVGSVRS